MPFWRTLNRDEWISDEEYEHRQIMSDMDFVRDNHILLVGITNNHIIPNTDVVVNSAGWHRQIDLPTFYNAVKELYKSWKVDERKRIKNSRIKKLE